MKYLQKQYNLLTGKRYWFSVRFIYKDKRHNKVFDFYSEIGMCVKSDILKHREISGTIPALHKFNIIRKDLLCNGKLEHEIICYIGHCKL